MFGHETNLNKFKKNEMIPIIFSNHNRMKRDVDSKKKKPEKSANMWKLNNTHLNNQLVQEEIKEKNLKIS